MDAYARRRENAPIIAIDSDHEQLSDQEGEDTEPLVDGPVAGSGQIQPPDDFEPSHPSNPLDIVYDAIRHLSGRHSQLDVPLRDVAALVAPYDLNPLQVREAVENWISLCEFSVDEGWQHVRAAHGAFQGPGCAHRTIPPTPPSGAPPRIALLSLFDGIGTARLGIGDVLQALGAQDALATSGFAELDAGLAAPVANYWGGGGARGPAGDRWTHPACRGRLGPPAR